MKQRFDELLPWYVNGTLSEQDRAWVDEYLSAHPESRAELEWYRSLAHKLHESAPAVPETIGLARTLTLIRGDRPTTSERVSGLLNRLGLGSLLEAMGPRPGLALAGVALVAVQGVAIVGLMRSADDSAAELRSLRATVTDEGPLLRLNFAPDAKEADIRLLLVSVGGRVVGGPSQLGDWYVAVPKGQEEAAARKLGGQPGVQAAVLVPGLPPRE